MDWPTPFGATLNAAGALFDDKGDFTDVRDGTAIAVVADQVVAFANHWRTQA